MIVIPRPAGCRASRLRVPPTFITDSGGGLQAFWRFDELGENLPAVEVLNKRLCLLLGGDTSCWNIDRLMRVPGSINWPNALKRGRGRVPALASMIEEDQGETVEPEALHVILPELPPEQRAPRDRVDLSGVEPLSLAEAGIKRKGRLYDALMSTDLAGRSERVLYVAGAMEAPH